MSGPVKSKNKKPRRDIRVDAAKAAARLKPVLERHLSKMLLNMKKTKKCLLSNEFMPPDSNSGVGDGPWLGQTLHTRNTLLAIADKGLNLEDQKFMGSLSFNEMKNYGYPNSAPEPSIMDFLAAHPTAIFRAMHRALCPDPSNRLWSLMAYDEIPHLGLNKFLHKAAMRIPDYKIARTREWAKETPYGWNFLNKKDLAVWIKSCSRLGGHFSSKIAAADHRKKAPKFIASGDIRKDAAKTLKKIMPDLLGSLDRKIRAVQKAEAFLKSGRPIPETILLEFELCQYAGGNISLYHSLKRIILNLRRSEDSTFWEFEMRYYLIDQKSRKEAEYLPVVDEFVKAYPYELYQILYEMDYPTPPTLAQRKYTHKILARSLYNKAVLKAGEKFRKKEFGFDPLAEKAKP